ncbi:MAG: CHAT domain-containing protein [Spirulinaceae cyanobacterium]
MPKPSLWLGSPLFLSLLLATPSFAQSITAAPDGTGTIINFDGNTYHLQGGTQAGANLFHSFQEFGLSSGEIANFLSNPSVTNILGRVTGGDPSVIDGLIQVTGANSNLYLMNPAGMVFGQGASLNVGGDFVATTADRIAVGDGWFISSGVNDYASLAGEPSQFAFASEKPGAILNFGDLSTEGNVSLLGGTVVNEGKVVSNVGNVTIAAVPGERLVKISQPGMLLSLEVDAGAIAAGISPADLPTLLTGSGRGNPPVVAPDLAGVGTGALPLQGDTIINGEVSGQQVDLYAAGQVTPTDADLLQGDTRVIRFSETGENPDQAMFIDARADNPQNLLYGAEAGTVSQVIGADENGIAVITEQLTEISDAVGKLESVAIVAEGNQGNFWLGSQWIRVENIDDYAAQLQTWGQALTASADILLYSCFTALGATGEALVNSIADITGADVAASIDATGSTNYGADWVLETEIGAIEAENPFMSQTLASWEGKLATLTVTDFTDGGGANTLRSLIGAAGAGDTVIFAAPSPITLIMGQIAWGTDNLTIDGNGGTVSAGAGSRVFSIAANNATVQNLTIQNGAPGGASDGGGINHSGTGSLAIINSTITNNIVGDDGGGIFSYGNVTLTNSTVSGNVADDNGGGVWSNGSITLNSSTISNNIATNSTGGGLVFYTPIPTAGQNVTIVDSIISDNFAGGVSGVGGAGGLFFRNSAGTLTISNSIVSGNSAPGSGGGIYGNTRNTTLNSSTISGNTAGTDGGGLFFNNAAGNLTISNSTIVNNSSGNNGGGIDSDGAVILNNSSASGNLANYKGGGITGAGIITLNNSTVSGNSATSDGGGVSSNAGTITLNSSTVSGNLAGDDGGGIYTISGTVNLTDSTASGNSAADFGGGIDNVSGAINLNRSTISGNSANEGGGLDSISGPLTVTNTTISGNSAANRGGGIFKTSGALNLTNATIAFNIAGGGGGGINATSPTGRIVNTIIANNTDASGGNAPDINANLGSTTVEHSLITSTAGISGRTLVNGVNGNIIGQDPLLGPLQNNGGSTATHALLPGSPAINAGKNDFVSVSIDQNGNLRIMDFNVDIGAYELQVITTPLPSICLQLGCAPPPVPLPNPLFLADEPPILDPIPEEAAIAIETVETVEADMTLDYLDLFWDDAAPADANSETTNETPLNYGQLVWDYAEIIAEQANAELAVDDIAYYIHTNRLLDELQQLDGTITPEDLEGLALPEIQSTFANIQSILQALQGEAGIQPALVYFTFAPLSSDLGDGSEQAQLAETLLASASPNLALLDLAQPHNQDELKLILVTPEAYPIVEPLSGVTRSQVMAQVRRFQRGLRPSQGDRYLDPAQQLYDWLIRPLEPHIAELGLDHLSIIPDAGLRSLPVAALHNGDRFLVEDYSLGILPSLSLIDWRYEAIDEARVLAMGASKFTSQVPLPAVPLELALISPNRQPFLNDRFTQDNLDDQTQDRQFQILHLATHAQFQPGAADAAYVQLWGEDRLQLKNLRNFGLYNAPAVELLILSACETAVGDADAELGFAGAALQAGVKSVLASLWQVSDLGTVALMNEFYEQLDNPEVSIKAEALRRAQLSLLYGQTDLQTGAIGTTPLPPVLVQFADADLSHPYYWSAFTLVGSPW